MTPLKVCLATWAPFVGGAEVAAERLAVGLRDAGHEVVLLVGQRGPVLDRLEAAGLRCVVAAMRFTGKWDYPRYWVARRTLVRILRRERPDVLHGNDLPTHAMTADAAWRAGVPRVCHHRFPFPGPAIDWMNKFGAERHVFVSRALMEEMCAASARLSAAHRSVVYDGLPIPAPPTTADRLQARAACGLLDDKVVVLFAGQVIERKGVADLIRAWGLLDDATRAKAALVVVGDDVAGGGAYRREMEVLARSTPGPVRFVGFQSDVGPWLRAADAAVVPSHVEPLGNATLEAMSHALPVIGTRVGGIPEMIVDGETGLLVPPREPVALSAALRRVIRDGGERHRLGGAGRHRCEEIFGIRNHVRQAIDTYQWVLQRTTAHTHQ